MEKEKFAIRAKRSLRARTSGIKTTRWVRFGIVALLWVLFTVWTGSWWLLLLLIPLFDIYITGYVPLTWWKKSRHRWVRVVMSWVDAIVYALVLVWFIFSFIGQNYQIPSSSLEKTLLTGDYLFVNKLTYGPRVPMTPINFPLVHNTLPILNCKSYLETPSFSYKRLPGLRSVETGDIVVFNFPAGDTVMTLAQNPDYYQLCRLYGSYAVNNDTRQFGEKITRPVDRRDNYVKRAVGLPGQRIQVKDGLVWIDGKKQVVPENVQFNYLFKSRRALTAREWEQLGVSEDDRQMALDPYGRAIVDEQGLYLMHAPLTKASLAMLKANPSVVEIRREDATQDPLGIYPFELADREGWTRSDYGGDNGVLIPAKGLTVPLTYDNWLLYERPIRVYENHPSAEWRDGHVYINGRRADTYTFGMDYYFMMGDNRDNSLDSRYWGFVPEDHVVGTPWRVIVSFDKDKPLFGGGIRWNRILAPSNPDKEAFEAAER